MMDVTYLDTHICLGCRFTIVGLDAYIQHKRYDCSVLKSKELQKKNGEQVPLMQKGSSDIHFNCDFTSAVTSGNTAISSLATTPNLPSGEYEQLARPSYTQLSSSWFDDVSNSRNNQSIFTNNLQPSSLMRCRVADDDILQPSSLSVPTMNCSAPSVDLVNNIVLYTEENCSFFDSLQLKSKATGQLQSEDKFKNAENLTGSKYPENKEMADMSPFLQQPKQLEHLCSFNSPGLKIESEMFNTSEVPSDSCEPKHVQPEHQSELYCQTKVLEDSMTYCWKNNTETSNLFDPPKTSDAVMITERKEDTGETSNAFDHSKALRIACMFHNLDLESDSDDFMPSDADDLLNFSDVEEEHNGFNHSHSDGRVAREKITTGGKLESYRHTEKLDAYTRSQGKLLKLKKEQNMQEQKAQKHLAKGGKQIATKWRPGERPAVLPRYRPHASRGKWQGPEGEDIDEDDQEEGEEDTDVEEKHEIGWEEESREKNSGEVNHQLTMACNNEDAQQLSTEGKVVTVVNDGKSKGKLLCEICNKTFTSQARMEHHMKTVLHKNCSQQQITTNTEQETELTHIKLECALCDKVFRSKYSFARHLMTSFHARRASYNEKHKLIANTGLEVGIELLIQRLQPFQCRICNFHTSDADALMNHLKTSEHSSHLDILSGPFMCVRCQYCSQSNDDMIQHVFSVEHVDAVKSSCQPCVLKEKRCKISCPSCGLVIHSTSHLASHQKTCQKSNSIRTRRQSDRSVPLRCADCTATFMTRFNLAVHVRRIHTKERPFQCRTCNKSFADNSSLKLHKQSKRHTEAVKSSLAKRDSSRSQSRTEEEEMVEEEENGQQKIHRCKQCDFVTERYSEVVLHCTMSHVPPDCAICGLRFMNQLQHDKHLLSTQHKKKEEESKTSAGNVYLCDKCPRKFYTVRSLKMHEMNHQLTNSRVARANASEPDDIELRCQKLVRDSKLQNGKIQCPECGKYLTKIGILPHLRHHVGIFPFQCTYCSKKFVDASIMRRHLKVHLGIRSYRCKFCGREFDRRLSLDTHMMREHKDTAGIVASHLCNICGRKFLQLNQLNAHLKFHDKTVHCPHPGCTLNFRYQSEMLIHMQVHTKETRFLCDECGYAGKTKNQLSRHRRVHTGEKRYKCSHCTYQAAHIANLKRHERVHTGNKPYQCPHCKYSCNTQENLRKHILKTKRHAGKPVYPCPRCEFGCNSATEFQSHMEIVHSISRNHLPSIVAGLYRREVDVWPFQDGTIDQGINGLIT